MTNAVHIKRKLGYGVPIVEGLVKLNLFHPEPLRIAVSTMTRTGGFRTRFYGKSFRFDGEEKQLDLVNTCWGVGKLPFVRATSSFWPRVAMSGQSNGRVINSDSVMVFRPGSHRAGQEMFVGTYQEFIEQNRWPIWYGRTYIEKDREFRVYILQNRIVAIQEKTPEDRTQVAWNHAQGATFSNVRWSRWPEPVLNAVYSILNRHDVNWCALDIMTKGDNAYPLEANACPALPLTEDGQPNYVVRKLFDCFRFNQYIPRPYGTHWKDMIHPAVYNRNT